MSEKALYYALDLADATHDLRLHLEKKQQVLLEENIADMGNLLGNETLLVRRIKKIQEELDTELRRLRLLPKNGGYSRWLSEQASLCSPEDQARLSRLAEDTIACQEMQVRQQELLQRSLIYYQSMTRFLSGVQQWTYDKAQITKHK